MDSLTRSYLRWCLTHPLEAAFRIVRWTNVDVDAGQRRLLYNLAVGLPDRDLANFGAEIEYLLERGTLEMLPYRRVKDGLKASGGFDAGLPYVEHGADRLYYPKGVPLPEAMLDYETLINDEAILGNGVRIKSPHSYESADFKVDAGSVLVDVGSAEGLFALDKVDIVSQVYLFECDKRWERPLNATFSKWADKVKIVRRFVSNRTVGNEILLTDALKKVPADIPLFVKMDIEGAERQVLESSLKFLRSRRVKLACCAYHRHDDEMELSRLLADAGFKVSHSDGWMLTLMNGLHYPYFRRGVLRAINY